MTDHPHPQTAEPYHAEACPPVPPPPPPDFNLLPKEESQPFQPLFHPVLSDVIAPHPAHPAQTVTVSVDHKSLAEKNISVKAPPPPPAPQFTVSPLVHLPPLHPHPHPPIQTTLTTLAHVGFVQVQEAVKI